MHAQKPRTIGPLLLVLTFLVLAGLALFALDRPVESAPAESAPDTLASGGLTGGNAHQDRAETGDTATSEVLEEPATEPWDVAPTPGEGTLVAGDPVRDIGPYLDADAAVSDLERRQEDAEPRDIGPALDPDAPPTAVPERVGESPALEAAHGAAVFGKIAGAVG